MKWFKHFSSAAYSDDLEWVRAHFGNEGYALWWLILEKIASGMDHTDKCYRVLPIQEWCRYLRVKRQKLISYLTQVQQKLNISWTLIDNELKIEICKLVELRDDTTKKQRIKKCHSGIIPEQEEEEDIEEDKDKKLEVDKSTSVELKKQLDDVFRFYRVVMDRPKYQLTKKRIVKLKQRLSEKPTGLIEWCRTRRDELLVAIGAVAMSDFHQGENESGKRYVELEDHCLKNPEQVEKRLIGLVENNREGKITLTKIKAFMEKEGYLDGKSNQRAGCGANPNNQEHLSKICT